jgi:hypothetical protein
MDHDSATIATGFPTKSTISMQKRGIGEIARLSLHFGGQHPYIDAVVLVATMAINGYRNKPFGPGGGTRRLHLTTARGGQAGAK